MNRVRVDRVRTRSGTVRVDRVRTESGLGQGGPVRVDRVRADRVRVDLVRVRVDLWVLGGRTYDDSPRHVGVMSRAEQSWL